LGGKGVYDAQDVVGLAERLASKPSASYLNGLTPRSPPIVPALLL